MDNPEAVRALSWEQAVCWLREQPDQQDLVRHCFYDDPVLAAAERYHQSQEWASVRRLLQGQLGDRVLDIGAGRGISTFAFAQEGADVTALEPDPSPVVGAGAIRALAQDSRLKIRVVEGAGESIPLPDSCFDVVYCRAVLHHARNLGGLLREAARLLRPGGVFLATREHVISRPKDLQAFLDSHPLHRLYGGEHAFLFSEYMAAIQAAGLVRTKWIGPYESPLNYHPATVEQIRAWSRRQLAFRLGGKIATCVLAIPPLEKFYLRWLSWRSNEPGRLFTFMAFKPLL